MTSSPSIFIAEDDPAIREGLTDSLSSEGYEVRSAPDGTQALAALQEQPADLLLLDIMMPGLSGYDVCRQLRSEGNQIPVLMLTAKGEEIDKVLGLELGADDYLTKPFGLRELLARVHALLRRSQPTAPQTESSKEVIHMGSIEVDPRCYVLRHEGQETPISDREMTLLRLFSEHSGEVLSRDELLNRAWGVEYYGSTRTLDQHIAQLRKKLPPETIETVHGIGYRWVLPST